MGTRLPLKVTLKRYIKMGNFHIDDVESLLQDIRDYLGFTEEKRARTAVYRVPALQWLARHEPHSRSSAVLMICLFLMESLED